MPVTAKDSLPTARQLRQSFFAKRAVLVVYGASDTTLTNKYHTLLEELANSPQGDSRRNVSVTFKEATKVDANELRENIVFLVGTPKGNPLVKTYSQNIPVGLFDDRFVFNTKEYVDRNMLLSLDFYPNPKNDTLPISLLSGTDENQVFELFNKKVQEGGRSFYRQNMDYEIYQGATRVVMGDFDPEWKLDTSTYFDYSSGSAVLARTEHFDFIFHQNAITPEALAPLSQKVEQTRAEILGFLGIQRQLPKFTYNVYKSAEEKGLMVGNASQAHFDTLDHSVHTVINEQYLDNFIEKENALLTRLLLGPSKTSALEKGLPLYFTKQWQREGYRYWSARLFESGNALSLSELLTNASLDIESPLIADCMSASLVSFLLDFWGKTKFLKHYSAWLPSEREIKDLEPEWQNYLSKNAAVMPKKVRTITDLPYQKGFNFAHEGYSIYNGYAGRKATLALEKMKSIGSNAMAIVPYS